MRGTITDDGLTLTNGQDLPWSDIYFVDWTKHCAILATRQGAVRVSREDGARAEAAIAPWEAARDAAVEAADPETVATWTSAPPGLLREEDRAFRLVPASGCVSALVITALAAVLIEVLRTVAGIPGLVFAGAVGAAVWGAGRKVTRSPAALTVDKQRIPWRDVLGAHVLGGGTLNRNDTRLLLRTRHGRLRLAAEAKPDNPALSLLLNGQWSARTRPPGTADIPVRSLLVLRLSSEPATQLGGHAGG